MIRERSYNEYLIHAIKTSIACAIGFLGTRLLGYESDQWIIISILVLMCGQIYVGSVFYKSYLRFLGTIIGCLISIFVIFALPHTNLVIGATIAFAGFVFSFIAVRFEKFNLAATLGAVTTAIILLGKQPTVPFALQRFLEISLGILIASLVSQFLFPITARSTLRKSQINTLDKIKAYFLKVCGSEGIDTFDYIELDEDIAKDLIKQRQLALESAREPLGITFNTKRFLEMLFYERQLLRSTTSMLVAINHLPVTNKILSGSEFDKLREAIIKSFDAIITVLETKSSANLAVTLPSVDTIKSTIQDKTVTYTKIDSMYLNGLVFSASIFTESLTEILKLYQIDVRTT